MQDYPYDADGDALRRVAASGSDMSRPMDIDFQVAAPDESMATKIAAEAAQLGYRVRIWFDEGEQDPVEEDYLRWTCNCTKTMLPDHGAIVAAQDELDRIAKPLGACIDGWGTFGNVKQAEPDASPGIGSS
jgi:regulator of RNase E activity RraB